MSGHYQAPFDPRHTDIVEGTDAGNYPHHDPEDEMFSGLAQQRFVSPADQQRSDLPWSPVIRRGAAIQLPGNQVPPSRGAMKSRRLPEVVNLCIQLNPALSKLHRQTMKVDSRHRHRICLGVSDRCFESPASGQELKDRIGVALGVGEITCALITYQKYLQEADDDEEGKL